MAIHTRVGRRRHIRNRRRLDLDNDGSSTSSNSSGDARLRLSFYRDRPDAGTKDEHVIGSVHADESATTATKLKNSPNAVVESHPRTSTTSREGSLRQSELGIHTAAGSAGTPPPPMLQDTCPPIAADRKQYTGVAADLQRISD